MLSSTPVPADMGRGPPQAHRHGFTIAVGRAGGPGGPGPRGLPPPVLNLLAGLALVGIWAFVVGRWVVAPLRQLSHAARALGTGDFTVRTRLSRTDELGEVGSAFDEMAERIQRLLLAERELLANVSHELRTPLARIRVALDLASEGDAEAARLSLSEISVDLAELEAILDDILTATRLERAEGNASRAGFWLHPAEMRPEEIVTQAVERFRTRHPARRLDVTVAAGLPDIKVDPVLFRRVIDNLLENAHKYTPNETAPIALGAALDEARVVFTIADRGMGISVEDLPHVFTAFFRSERSRTRSAGGVGLGLTLVKRIVEGHDGTVDVVSGPGGTTFRVEIPGSQHFATKGQER